MSASTLQTIDHPDELTAPGGPLSIDLGRGPGSSLTTKEPIPEDGRLLVVGVEKKVSVANVMAVEGGGGRAGVTMYEAVWGKASITDAELGPRAHPFESFIACSSLFDAPSTGAPEYQLVTAPGTYMGELVGGPLRVIHYDDPPDVVAFEAELTRIFGQPRLGERDSRAELRALESVLRSAPIAGVEVSDVEVYWADGARPDDAAESSTVPQVESAAVPQVESATPMPSESASGSSAPTVDSAMSWPIVATAVVLTLVLLAGTVAIANRKLRDG